MKVLFIDGTDGFSPDRLETKPSGGIITSLTLVPRFLAGHGVGVVVASAFQKEVVDQGVAYTPIVRDVDMDADVVVFNRNCMDNGMVSRFPKAKKVWWLHDIVDHRYMPDDCFNRMDKIVALSGYCQESFSDFYGINQNKFVRIPNGVDKTIFAPSEKHDKNLFVCASAPIKGLYPLMFTFHNLLRENPNAELRIYSNQSLHDKKNNTQSETLLRQLRDGGAKVIDPIPQKELAEVISSARALLMPNHYPEICSNLILQAQACGTPVITSGIGSASEFITNGLTGYVTRRRPDDMYWWWKEFADLAVKVSHYDSVYEKIHANAPSTVKTWDQIGEMWLTMVRGL